MEPPIEWGEALRRAIDGDGIVSAAMQPIVDLRRGTVVGYELLARFTAPPTAGPDRWFAAADEHDLGPDLAAVTVRIGMAALADLPPRHLPHPEPRATATSAHPPYALPSRARTGSTGSCSN